MPIFDLLSKSEVKGFVNIAEDPVRARALLEKNSYTSGSTNEFATITNKLIHEATTSKNLGFKQSIELFGSKMKKCFQTKGIYKQVAPNFLILSKNISSLLEDPDENLPPVVEYSSGEEEESDTDHTPNVGESPDMSTFGEALLAEPKRSFATTPSSSSQAPTPTPTRTPSPRAPTSDARARSRSPLNRSDAARARSRSPLNRSDSAPRGEKSKKSSSSKRSPSSSSAAERSRSSTKAEIGNRNRSPNKSEERGADEEFSRSQPRNKRSPWNQLNYTVEKKVGVSAVQTMPLAFDLSAAKRHSVCVGYHDSLRENGSFNKMLTEDTITICSYGKKSTEPWKIYLSLEDTAKLVQFLGFILNWKRNSYREHTSASGNFKMPSAPENEALNKTNGLQLDFCKDILARINNLNPLDPVDEEAGSAKKKQKMKR